MAIKNPGGVASAVVAVVCCTGSGSSIERARLPGTRSNTLPAPEVVIGAHPYRCSPARIRARVAAASGRSRSPMRGQSRSQSMIDAAGAVAGSHTPRQSMHCHTHCWR